MPPSPPGRRIAVGVLALLVLILGNSWYRTKTGGLWSHPDQVIPVKVLQTMHAHGDLDTDWARADLPHYFQACRYNFSGYMLAAYLATRATAPQAFSSDGALASQLMRFSRWCATLTLLLTFLLLVRQLGIVPAIAGTLAVAWTPQLFQDAHYARPEALATLCLTACFALATLQPARRSRQLLLAAAIAALAGFLTTIKFTFAVATLFAVVPGLAALRQDADWRRRASTAALFAGCIAVALLAGVWIGAPAAVLDPGGYVEGVRALQQQYAGGHPPHGRMQGGVTAQAGLVAGFHLAVLGLPALLLHLAGYAGRTMAPAKYAYAAVLALTVAGFLLQKVFFERNFSPLLAVFAIVVVLGIANAARWIRGADGSRMRTALALAAALVLFAASQYRALPTTLALAPHFVREGFLAERARREAREQSAIAASGAAGVVPLSFRDVHGRRYPAAGGDCVVYKAHLYGDDWSARFLQDMPQRLHIVDTIASDFPRVPTSTLHTYHSATAVLFVDSAACTGARR